MWVLRQCMQRHIPADLQSLLSAAAATTLHALVKAVAVQQELIFTCYNDASAGVMVDMVCVLHSFKCQLCCMRESLPAVPCSRCSSGVN